MLIDDWWQQMREAGAPLPYVLIDCAGLPGGYADLPVEAFSELECLFTGELAEELADVSGYLGRMRSWDEGVEKLVAGLMRRQVALLLVGDVAFAEAHRHLRKFNVVYGTSGQPLFWRYYDPRALPTVFEVLEPAQRRGFMGRFSEIRLASAEGELLGMSADFPAPADLPVRV